MLSLLSIPVSFKEVYSTTVRDFHVNPNWTIRQFIESVSPHISREFNLTEDDLEIIEAGQYNFQGLPPEAAPALIKNDIILRDKWGTNLSVAFYIRNKSISYPQLNANNTLIIDDCPICLETVRVFSRQGCVHRICNNCNNMCIRMNYTVCPVCRHD